MESIVLCDAQLHGAWRAGDRRAAATLIGTYHSRLRSLGQRLGLSLADAEDLAQQVLLEAYRANYESRPGVTYFHWLSAIARRQSFQIVARRREAGELPLRRPTSPWTGTWRGRLVARIEGMPEHLHDVFVRLLAGYTPAEIADELDLTASALRMRIYRGRLWLRANER